LVLAYGVLGMVLNVVGRAFQDKLVFRDLDIHAEVMKENVSVAILDFANSLSTSICVWSSMTWVVGDWEALLGVFIGFIISQVWLSLLAMGGQYVFAMRATAVVVPMTSFAEKPKNSEEKEVEDSLFWYCSRLCSGVNGEGRGG
jgi:hypothetical protein